MAAISMNKEVREAGKKFEADFKFSEMETMIHLFPAALGAELSIRYPHMVVPRFVAIGPYHHGKDHLKKMEEVKNAAAYYLCQRMEVEPDVAMDAVLAVVDEARTKYYYHEEAVVEGEEEEEGKAKAKASFAAMMFRDACFLLLYMDACNRSIGDKEDDVINRSMRRFLFSNRDNINSDIMLLENQLPWLVIKALVDFADSKSQTLKTDLYHAVGNFIARIGNSFKITVSQDDQSATYEWDDEKHPPAHLLALLRRYRNESASKGHGHVVQVPDDALPPPSNGLHDRLITPSAPTPPPPELPLVKKISSMSPQNLQEIGIMLTTSSTASCLDMGLVEGPVFSSITVVPLVLSDMGASYLVNMAALEICTASRFGDDAEKTAVCSYLALLAFFMVEPEDVRRLRSIGLLHGSLNDGDVLAFFNAIVKHLPSGKHFAILMTQIEKYKETRPIKTKLIRWVHNNYKTIMAVVPVIITVIGFYQALLKLIHNTK